MQQLTLWTMGTTAGRSDGTTVRMDAGDDRGMLQGVSQIGTVVQMSDWVQARADVKHAGQARRYVANYRVGESQTKYPVRTKEQLDTLAVWIRDHRRNDLHLVAFVLGVNTGLRANELLGLRWSDVLWENGTVKQIDDMEDTTDVVRVRQSKTAKVREIYLNDGCAEVLRWYLKKHGRPEDRMQYIFASRTGGCWIVDTLNKTMKEAGKACGIRQELGSHSLRKTFGWFTALADADGPDVNVTQLQRIFGHESAQTTLRYIGYTDTEDKRLYHRMTLRFTEVLTGEKR